MMDELKRCPFCGGEGTHKLGEVVIEETVFCLDCEIAIPTEIWQKRHIDNDSEYKRIKNEYNRDILLDLMD
jgi:hypothetical protein